MFNKQYYPGDRVPEGGTRYFIMKHGSFQKEVVVPYMYFPPFETPSQDYYYIKAV